MRDPGLFKTLLGEIERYFNKDLTDNQAKFYWNECGHWDRPDLERGLQELMRTKRPIPSNFPTPVELNHTCTLMGGKSGLRPEHVRTRCHACYDTGYLRIHCKRLDYDYEEIALCGHCENWRIDDLHIPGYKGARDEWKSNVVPRFTIDQFDLDIVGKYRRKGIEAKLITSTHLDKKRRENDMRFGIREGMTIDECDRREQQVLGKTQNPLADGGYTVGEEIT